MPIRRTKAMARRRTSRNAATETARTPAVDPARRATRRARLPALEVAGTQDLKEVVGLSARLSLA